MVKFSIYLNRHVFVMDWSLPEATNEEEMIFVFKTWTYEYLLFLLLFLLFLFVCLFICLFFSIKMTANYAKTFCCFFFVFFFVCLFVWFSVLKWLRSMQKHFVVFVIFVFVCLFVCFSVLKWLRIMQRHDGVCSLMVCFQHALLLFVQIESEIFAAL